MAIAGVAFTHIPTQGYPAAPFALGLAGNDIDHPANRFGAVKGGHRAADYLDALDLLDTDPPVLVVGVANRVIGRGDASAIDQHERVAIFGAANAQGLATSNLAPIEGDARCPTERLKQVGRTSRADLLGGDNGHRSWRVCQ
ncbi:hypothetical protein UIB01_09535 [Stutzerimonas decontaminans]|uniref:Uncharacterized protein n=1 Tax=Stutzerimonas stutzeri TaxID=316 RepID=A0A023WYF6_STUST|nr:hypothetical protein UIB01_09535 [Stutzerimonas decontaminans]